MSTLLTKLREAAAANSAPTGNLPSDVVEFPKRGRRLNAQQIREEFYGSHVGEEWVHDHVAYRCWISKKVVLWWEYDVLTHLEEERARALAGQGPRKRERQPKSPKEKKVATSPQRDGAVREAA